MKTIVKNITLIIAFIITANFVNAQGDFISAAEFAKISKDKNTVVISAQKEKNYNTSHITGSVYINHKDLNKTTGPEGVLKSTADLAKIFGSKCVSDKNLIVIYDDGVNKYSTRIYWILKYLGAPNVKLLHKDLTQWRNARVPLTKGVTKIVPTTFTAKLNTSIITDYDFVNANLENAKVILVDVRALNEFDGTSTDPVSKGHIPGAKNLEWSKIESESGALLPAAELTKMFNSMGITKDKTVILYCATSVRAGIMYVAFQSLGYTDVKVYDGAYNEWEAKGGKIVK